AAIGDQALGRVAHEGDAGGDRGPVKTPCHSVQGSSTAHEGCRSFGHIRAWFDTADAGQESLSPSYLDAGARCTERARHADGAETTGKDREGGGGYGEGVHTRFQVVAVAAMIDMINLVDDRSPAQISAPGEGQWRSHRGRSSKGQT